MLLSLQSFSQVKIDKEELNQRVAAENLRLLLEIDELDKEFLPLLVKKVSDWEHDTAKNASGLSVTTAVATYFIAWSSGIHSGQHANIVAGISAGLGGILSLGSSAVVFSPSARNSFKKKHRKYKGLEEIDPKVSQAQFELEEGIDQMMRFLERAFELGVQASDSVRKAIHAEAFKVFHRNNLSGRISEDKIHKEKTVLNIAIETLRNMKKDNEINKSLKMMQQLVKFKNAFDSLKIGKNTLAQMGEDLESYQSDLELNIDVQKTLLNYTKDYFKRSNHQDGVEHVNALLGKLQMIEEASELQNN